MSQAFALSLVDFARNFETIADPDDLVAAFGYYGISTPELVNLWNYFDDPNLWPNIKQFHERNPDALINFHSCLSYLCSVQEAKGFVARCLNQTGGLMHRARLLLSLVPTIFAMLPMEFAEQTVRAARILAPQSPVILHAVVVARLDVTMSETRQGLLQCIPLSEISMTGSKNPIVCIAQLAELKPDNALIGNLVNKANLASIRTLSTANQMDFGKWLIRAGWDIDSTWFVVNDTFVAWASKKLEDSFRSYGPPPIYVLAGAVVEIFTYARSLDRNAAGFRMWMLRVADRLEQIRAVLRGPHVLPTDRAEFVDLVDDLLRPDDRDDEEIQLLVSKVADFSLESSVDNSDSESSPDSSLSLESDLMLPADPIQVMNPSLPIIPFGYLHDSGKNLGCGSFGAVRLHLYDGPLAIPRMVAVKTLFHPQALKYFLRESAALRQVYGHPHIVQCYGTTTNEHGQHGIVLEYVEGYDLFEHLAVRGLSDQQCLDLALQVSDALAHIHQHNYIFRDLSTGNVMFSPIGFKIIDFGLCVEFTKHTMTRKIGDSVYQDHKGMESGHYDARVDVYSFGCVLLSAISRKQLSTVRDLESIRKRDKWSPFRRALWGIARLCIVHITKRPPLAEIRKRIEDVQALLAATGVDDAAPSPKKPHKERTGRGRREAVALGASGCDPCRGSERDVPRVPVTISGQPCAVSAAPFIARNPQLNRQSLDRTYLIQKPTGCDAMITCIPVFCFYCGECIPDAEAAGPSHGPHFAEMDMGVDYPRSGWCKHRLADSGC